MTFDVPLVPGVLDAPNWSLRWVGQRYGISDAEAGVFGPNEILLDLALPPFPDFGRDELIYSPPPFDVVSLEAVPGQPFVLETFV